MYLIYYHSGFRVISCSNDSNVVCITILEQRKGTDILQVILQFVVISCVYINPNIKPKYT